MRHIENFLAYPRQNLCNLFSRHRHRPQIFGKLSKLNFGRLKFGALSNCASFSLFSLLIKYVIPICPNSPQSHGVNSDNFCIDFNQKYLSYDRENFRRNSLGQHCAKIRRSYPVIRYLAVWISEHT